MYNYQVRVRDFVHFLRPLHSCYLCRGCTFQELKEALVVLRSTPWEELQLWPGARWL